MDRHKAKFLLCNIKPALNRLLFDRPSPMFVEFFVTRNCNLRCSYCFTYKSRHKEPTTDELKARIDRLKELGCNVISFMGGEPTLRSDLVELTRHCSRKKMFVSMDTNGLLFDEHLIDGLAKAGMDTVVVSLDGINRLKGSKKTIAENPKLIDNLRYAAKRGVRPFVNLVLTKENIDEVIPLLELTEKNRIIFTLSLITKNPECRIDGKKNFEYSTKDIRSFDDLFEKLVEKKKAGYLMFEPLKYYEQLKEFIRGRYDWQCRAGRHFFSVDSDGGFLLCSDSKPIDMNIMEMDKHYWKKHKAMFEERLQGCNKTCPENYAFCSSYYSDRKIEFARRRW